MALLLEVAYKVITLQGLTRKAKILKRTQILFHTANQIEARSQSLDPCSNDIGPTERIEKTRQNSNEKNGQDVESIRKPKVQKCGE